ncbi:DUF4354 family protein [Serratia fonticola]|uniref:DUF4354 family protein n=1 Tax=Serratia fonticola TaxID=47917 RepID=UPI002DBBD566|nr:DUF4354 family protein [Serratia fonticola]
MPVGQIDRIPAYCRGLLHRFLSRSWIRVWPLICRLNPLHYDVFYTEDFTVVVANLPDKDLDLSKLCLQASSANKLLLQFN